MCTHTHAHTHIPPNTHTHTRARAQDKWVNLAGVLHPTQQAVGYAWIQRKLKDFGTQSDAQTEMDDSPLPFVLGPNNVPYIADDHHTISALHASGFN